jgi:hypothetical protein
LDAEKDAFRHMLQIQKSQLNLLSAIIEQAEYDREFTVFPTSKLKYEKGLITAFGRI